MESLMKTLDHGKRMKLAAALCGAFALAGCSREGRAPDVSFDFENVRRGRLVSTIAASGTIEPEELVDVGAQVSGKIVAFGADVSGAEVDYCSAVTNGMTLARIDDVTYLADLDVARAQLESANAAVKSAEAGHAKAVVDRDRARKELDRAVKIGVGLALSQSDYDSCLAAFESAEAQLGVAAAAISQAEAQVVQAKASVEKAERNLAYCTIASPVDGVVIDRRVNLGQTVVSSMSASSLFLVAKDLGRMRIWAAVNEADVGRIREGQGVAFTVDAFPGRAFRGVVRKVRLNATVTSNVVTYTVEIDVDNSDGTLMPYLTANVEFETDSVDDALLVPSRALRFSPPGAPAGPSAENEGTLWVGTPGADATLRRVRVGVLLNDGASAAVKPLDGELSENDSVATRATQRGSSDGAGSGAGQRNPFMPKMPGPPKNRRPPA